REVRQQIFHLVGQHATPLEENVLRIGRSEGHRDELHFRLFRCAGRLLVVATSASGYDVRPDIEAALAEGPDMIPRQLTRRESHGAIHTQVCVTPEQSLVV